MRRKNEPDLDEQVATIRAVLAEAKREGVVIDPVLRITVEAVCDMADALAGRLFYGFTASGAIRLWRRDRPTRRKKPGAKLCGAKTRDKFTATGERIPGTPCRCLPVAGRNRCKFHGGASTGPKTAEGRARIAESNRNRENKAREAAQTKKSSTTTEAAQ